MLISGVTEIRAISVGSVGPLAPLSQLAQPISQLYYKGDFPELVTKPMVAIVGSRKVSPYGQAVTTKLAAVLARAGVVIVSGLALGVDSIAHRAALEAGGQCLAILPTSPDRIYPASHNQLAKQIVAQGGALVSERPPNNETPQKWQFIARNRIIAAISQGVVITEAAVRSGSLHTANFALEQGKDVFAVPGNISSPLSAGANSLLQNGAHMVLRPEDILEVLNIRPLINTVQGSDLSNLTHPQQLIVDVLKENSLPMQQLGNATKLNIAELSQALTMLEIDNIVQQTSPNYWSLV